MILDNKTFTNSENQSNLKELTNQIPSDIGKLETNSIGDKLVSCVEMIKHLIQLNDGLRLSFDEANLRIKDYEHKNQSLEEENVELRERIEMLESILVNNEKQKKENIKSPKKEKHRRSTKSKNLFSNNSQSDLISRNYYIYHSTNIHH